ncbi:MAG TPA: hypothetical protein VNW90_14225 [Acetobacteraceae bacterium]|nr:hypothetical protein [Acetobacteraceae bacterium]
MQAVEPDGAAWGVRSPSGSLVALAVGSVEVVAWTVAVLVVLVGAALECLALGSRASVVRLAVGARALLRPGVLRVGALALAGGCVVATLLSVVRLAVGGVWAGGAACAAATAVGWRSLGAAVAVGGGRFHWWTV